MNYYDQQLNQFNKPNSITKVQFIGENLNNGEVKTNWMNLNKESIDAIRDFLDVVESELTE